MKHARQLITRKATVAARIFAFALVGLGLMAASASAAPVWSVSLTNDPTTLPRTDERMIYQATVSNKSVVAPGTSLNCDALPPAHPWTGAVNFSYKWLRNGAVIASQEASSYTLTGTDEHAAIQCMVVGTNQVGDAAVASLSQPPVISVSQPTPSIPLPSSAPNETSRPTVSGTGNALRTCVTSSMNWEGVSSFGYQWLRNGVPIAGATTSEYTPGPSDTAVQLQCEVFPKNATGVSAASVSNPSPTTGAATMSQPGAATRVTTLSSVASSGTVTLVLELPGGSETLPYQMDAESGWKNCVKQPAIGAVHAQVICTRSDRIEPGASSSFKVIVNLGHDAEEPVGIATATVSGGGGAPASDTAEYTFGPGEPFGILANSFSAKVSDELGNDHTQAGGHPYSAFTTFGFNVHRAVTDEVLPTESIKDIVFDAPRGFVGNALTAPELCPSMEDVIFGTCGANSAVGGVDVYTIPLRPALSINMYPSHLTNPWFMDRPLYSLLPEYGQPAQFGFGFILGLNPYTFVPEVRADEGYAISFRTAPIIMTPPLWGTNVTLCGFGANIVDSGDFLTGSQFTTCKKTADTGANPLPLITNPTRCAGPPPTSGLKVDSWQHPAEVRTAEFSAPPIDECEAVEFTPEAELQPTNREADMPTGLGVEFSMPTDGLLSNTGVAQANLDNVTVTLPEGMTINGSAADGLGSCSLAQVKMGSNAPDECPESSKVGTIEIETPLIRETLTGDIYVAQQNSNPFNAPLGLYMVFDSKRDGIRIKIAGKLTPDPVTGQLVSSFVENPEWPFSRLELHFTQGPRSPLVNPPKCGTYAIRAEFSPWSAVNPANPTPDEIVVDDSTYEVTEGPNGSPCPGSTLAPKLSAGVTNTQAGSTSPFVFSLSREDGTQRFNKIDVTTPRGLTAYLKGIPYCSDATLAGISGAEETGRAELTSPSCPAASQVGTSQAGAGSGPFPFYARGMVYLAGPYKGAPVSLAVVTPAVAGPYDLGNVVVRNPLYVDPVTSQVKTESDPIPTIKHGIVLNVRDIRVSLDRPNFTKAPTNCEPMAVDAHVSGLEGGDANLSNRFQVGGCENLGFKPKLGFRLFGGTKRGAHPKLRATVTMPEGGANIASASVALPHSAFLDQAHIKTVCTRVQYAADQCPPGSIYGEAEATTPLLDQPVRGPAILRSSNNQLPDLVLALRGPDSQPIEIDLAGKIDSVHGGIRTTFESIPDQPVSTFTLNMQGGKKGLLVNSKDICVGTQKATAVFNAQNGLSTKLRPVMKNSCGKTRKKAKQARQQRAAKRNRSH